MDRKVKNWMTRELQNNSSDYDDCGEVNCTRLAENAAQAMDLYLDDPDFTIPSEVFDAAVMVAEKFEKMNQAVGA